MLTYFEKKAKELHQKPKENLPDWVSKKNMSYKAWLLIKELKKEKLQYIKSHHKKTDFSKKGNYQIWDTDISNILGADRPTLMGKSSYSRCLKTYIKNVNEDLNSKKEAKLKEIESSPSRGSIRNSKNELVRKNQELKDQLKELQQKNIEALVTQAFDKIPLPVKKKLGIN